jgi:hypothetical protein
VHAHHLPLQQDHHIAFKYLDLAYTQNKN